MENRITRQEEAEKKARAGQRLPAGTLPLPLDLSFLMILFSMILSRGMKEPAIRHESPP
jgi:hypothetical protein